MGVTPTQRAQGYTDMIAYELDKIKDCGQRKKAAKEGFDIINEAGSTCNGTKEKKKHQAVNANIASYAKDVAKQLKKVTCKKNVRSEYAGKLVKRFANSNDCKLNKPMKKKRKRRRRLRH